MLKRNEIKCLQLKKKKEKCEIGIHLYNLSHQISTGD